LHWDNKTENLFRKRYQLVHKAQNRLCGVCGV
jgi:hypothetical protein